MRETVAGLIEAVQRGSVHDAERILKAGVDPNGKAEADDRTPLIHAAISGDRRMTRLLVSYGADPNCTDDVDWNASMYAGLEGFDHIVNDLDPLVGSESDAVRT
ncbi:MAG: ankyrin repeat domain-containing protein [Pseudomonadota bacterium]